MSSSVSLLLSPLFSSQSKDQIKIWYGKSKRQKKANQKKSKNNTNQQKQSKQFVFHGGIYHMGCFVLCYYVVYFF
jgi:hypothetical protein